MVYIKRTYQDLRTMYTTDELPEQFKKGMRVYKKSPDQINFPLFKEAVIKPLHETLLKKLTPQEIPQIKNICDIYGGHIIAILFQEATNSQANDNQNKSQ